jgi:hypothetical protein
VVLVTTPSMAEDPRAIFSALWASDASGRPVSRPRDPASWRVADAREEAVSARCSTPPITPFPISAERHEPEVRRLPAAPSDHPFSCTVASFPIPVLPSAVEGNASAPLSITATLYRLSTFAGYRRSPHSATTLSVTIPPFFRERRERYERSQRSEQREQRERCDCVCFVNALKPHTHCS